MPNYVNTYTAIDLFAKIAQYSTKASTNNIKPKYIRVFLLYTAKRCPALQTIITISFFAGICNTTSGKLRYTIHQEKNNIK